MSEGSDDVTRYRQLIDAAARFTPTGEYDTELHVTVARARHGIRSLERLTWLSRAQNLKFALLFAASPPVFFLFLLYVALQFVCLWDFHVAGALSTWRRRFGPSIDESLEAVGELEVLSSLAAVAHEHPDWTFAEFRGDGARDRGSPARTPAFAPRDVRAQRCHGRSAGKRARRHGLEHVRQEHAASCLGNKRRPAQAGGPVLRGRCVCLRSRSRR